MIDYKFCNQKGRCSVCGGAIKGKNSFHTNESDCIEVLQNTLKISTENNNRDFKLLCYLMKDFTQEETDEIETIVFKT